MARRHQKGIWTGTKREPKMASIAPDTDEGRSCRPLGHWTAEQLRGFPPKRAPPLAERPSALRKLRESSRRDESKPATRKELQWPSTLTSASPLASTGAPPPPRTRWRATARRTTGGPGNRRGGQPPRGACPAG